MRELPNRIVIEQVGKELSPVGESASNGAVENAIKMVQAQYRTLKLCLESRYENDIAHDHHAQPWLIRHAANTINRYQVGEDGHT